MKNTLIIRFFPIILTFCLLYVSVALADGKFRITQTTEYVMPSSTLVFKSLNSELLPPTQSENITVETVPDQKENNNSNNKTDAINTIVNGDGSVHVVLPQPQKTIVQPENKLFRSGGITGIIAWNGKTDENGEEILIVESTEISATKQNEASIGIIPLPGKPLSVNRLNKNILNQTKTILSKKFPSVGKVTPEPVQYPEVASFTVLVLEVKNIDSFIKDLNYYVQKFYDCKIRIDFKSDDLNVIKNYWDQGFRYFAIDIAPLLARSVTKQPLIFHFKSKFAYYPLAINAIGGVGRSTFDLIVMTPDNINLGGAFEQNKEEAKLRLIGNKTLDFSLTELQKLDARLAKIFEAYGDNPIKVRNFWILSEDCSKFTKDFTAFPIVSDKDNPKEPISDETTTPPTDTPTTPISDIPTNPVPENTEPPQSISIPVPEIQQPTS